MKLLRIGGLLLLASLAGCSTIADWFPGKKHGRTPAELTEFKPGATIDVRWHQGVGGAGGSVLQPAVTHDAVYAANGKGEVFRLDPATGKEVWRADSGFEVAGGVGAGSGLVLVGGLKGEVAAFGEDGKLRWKTKATSEVLSAPEASGDIVVVRTGDGKIAGLSAADGKRQWLYERPTPALIVRSHAGVGIARGMVFAGFAGGRMALIRVNNGIALWEATVSTPHGNTELERISDITSIPAFDNEQVCAVAYQGSVGCFDLFQGSLLWNREMSSDKGLTLSGRFLFVTDAEGNVSALDKATGSSVWKNEQLSLRRTTAPFAVGEYVAVGDFEGYLHLLNREDGAFAARIKLGGEMVAPPVGLDNGMLVQTKDGELYSLAVH